MPGTPGRVVSTAGTAARTRSGPAHARRRARHASASHRLPIRLAFVLAVLVALIASSSAAWGLFSTTTSQTNNFDAGNIAAATSFTAGSVTASSAVLSWTAPVGYTPTGDTITQSSGTLAGTCSNSNPTSGCTVTGLSVATPYTWTLTYSYGGWKAQVTVTATTASNLTYSATGTAATRTNSGSLTVSYPTGTNVNDLLLLVEVTHAQSTPATPSGWSPIADVGRTANNGHGNPIELTVFWKLAGSGESSVTVTTSGTAGAWVVRYARSSGYPPNPATATASVPTGTTASGNNTPPSTFTPSPNVTTNQADATVISIGAVNTSDTLSLSTAQSFTARSTPTISNVAALGVADQLVPTAAGSDASPTWSEGSANSDSWAWATVAFY